ncbi:BBSome complex member BBS7-like [Epargyreus clarus]|uniref:BBSome complex member BBS7-like n=1 Tax=Epargyreus clarus TaxID=520877 RepID=UPI003C2F39F7
MDYDLARIDYTVCGITYPDTMKILPGAGLMVQQKFAIGDKNGVLQCLSIKDEEPTVHFKTLPGKPITSVQVASSSGTASDKIFAASGNEVKGYTRKGKVFLSIETSLSETITSMCVLGSDLILCSGHTITYYRDLQEHYTYICDDRVLDIAAFATPNSNRVRLLVLIANKGAAVLENGQLLSRTHIASGPSRLSVPPATHNTELYSFYGAADGSIGIISYEESKLSSVCLVEGRGLGSVVCIGWYSGSSGLHLAIGRHDGSIQLYLLNANDFGDKPRLKYTYFCGEPVTSVCGGCVSSDENELLIATFSGRIFALRSKRVSAQASILNNASLDALTSRRTKLEQEIARLEKQTANERDKYQRNTRSLYVGVSAPPLLEIQYELSGATINGWQEAKITSAVPLDMLFIYCSKKLNIQTDSAAVLSLCSSQGNSTDLLATVRCQAGTRRFWMRIRTVLEKTSISEATQVLVYVLPSGAPRVARLIKLQLPALPYYSKHEDYDLFDSRYPCELRVSGSFSVAEMTSWLTDALPGELPRPAASITIARSHTLLGTVLVCRYQRGLAVFKSDNVSTIAVMRDLISNCSVQKSIQLDISCDLSENCCVKSFQRLRDLIESEYQKSKEDKLRNALSSLDLDDNLANDESTPILCSDYQKILNGSPSNDTKETYFEELIGMIEQWYIDWCKLSLEGNYYNTEHNILRLRNALQNCSLDDVLHILTNRSVADT